MNFNDRPMQPDAALANKKGFIASLTAKVHKILHGKDVSSYPQSVQRTSEQGLGDAAPSAHYAQFRLQWDRRSIYFDLDEMDKNDPVVATGLSIIAECATGYEDTDEDAFVWMIEQKNDAARKILDEMKSRLELNSEMWQIVRSFVKQGEEFRELVVDDEGIVRRFKSLPSYQISPILDQYGNKQPGWQQRRDGVYHGQVITFPEWAIVPFVYGPKRGWQGTGLMLPARRTHRRLSKMQDGMAIARMIRAYDKYLHRIPVGTNWDEDRQDRAVSNYKRNITKIKGLDEDSHLLMRDNPMQVETNFYIPDDGSNKAGIEILKSENIQLQNIEDVLHHQSLLLACLKVPSKYLNLVRKSGALTDAGLSAEDVQFARTLRQVQAVERMGLMRLGSVALAFQGFDADEIGLKVNLPKVSTDDLLQDAKIQFTLAQAADLFSQILGYLPPELVMDKYMQLDDDEKELTAKALKEKEAEEEAAAKEMERKMAAGEVPGQSPGQSPPTNGFRPRPTETSTRRGATGRYRSRREPAVGGEGVDAQEFARVLTKLQILCQAEMEERGISFDMGYEERLQLTRQAIAEQLAFR